MGVSCGASRLHESMTIADLEITAIANVDADLYMSILDEQAVMFPPNSAPKKGTELREWLRDFVQNNRVEWRKFSKGEMVRAGEFEFYDYAYTMQTTPNKGGPVIVAHGKGIEIFRRQADGSWKIFRNIWNSRPEDSSI